MKLKTMTTAVLMALAPLLAAGWELEKVKIDSYQLGPLDLECRPAARALRCRLTDEEGEIVGRASAERQKGWIELDSVARTVVREKRRGRTTLLILVHPRIEKNLVLRFDGLAAKGQLSKDRNGNGRKGQSREGQSREGQSREGRSRTDESQVAESRAAGSETAERRTRGAGGSARLAAPGGTQEGGRDEEGPIGPGGLAVGGQPTSVRIEQRGRAGTAFATVPMEHDSCGIDCGTHSLADSGGDLELPIEISVSCPIGQQVEYVAYQVEGQFLQVLVNSQQPSGSFDDTVEIIPNSAEDLEEACSDALGGSWPLNNPHPDVDEEEKALLLKIVNALGRCTGDGANTTAQVSTKTQLTCVDEDYPSPPVG